jgi:hypothetical protein
MRNAFGDVIWRARRSAARSLTDQARAAHIERLRMQLLELGCIQPEAHEFVALATACNLEPAELFRRMVAQYDVLTRASERARRPRGNKQHQHTRATG